ncbi:hypothetical protein Tco_0984752 [Tanacetum coccineum]
MSTLAENVLAAGVENRPPMLKKGCYDTWQSCMLLFIEGKEHGEMLLDLIFSGPFEFKEIIPKWSRFVIGVKQARNLHEVSFDQLYAYLKHNEPNANEVRSMKARFPYPLALIANTYNPPPSYSSYKL